VTAGRTRRSILTLSPKIITVSSSQTGHSLSQILAMVVRR
jgi:hypothetical protein